MSQTNTNHKVHNIFLVVLTVYSIITLCLCLFVKNVIDENCLIVKIIAYAVFLFYFLKEIWRHKLDLKRKDPEYNFIIEQIWNLNLLFEVIILVKTFYSNYENIYVTLFLASIIIVSVSTFYNVYNLLKYSKKGLTILICLLLTFVLGLFNENNQTVLTILTTLMTAVFGRTILKNVFSSQITYYEKNKKIKKEVILDTLEYKLAMVNIIVIFTRLIIVITNFLNSISFINELNCIEKYLTIGIIRFMILASTYLLFLSKYRKKLKERLFNYLMNLKIKTVIHKQNIICNYNSHYLKSYIYRTCFYTQLLMNL